MVGPDADVGADQGLFEVVPRLVVDLGAGEDRADVLAEDARALPRRSRNEGLTTTSGGASGGGSASASSSSAIVASSIAGGGASTAVDVEGPAAGRAGGSSSTPRRGRRAIRIAAPPMMTSTTTTKTTVPTFTRGNYPCPAERARQRDEAAVGGVPKGRRTKRSADLLGAEPRARPPPGGRQPMGRAREGKVPFPSRRRPVPRRRRGWHRGTGGFGGTDYFDLVEPSVTCAVA